MAVYGYARVSTARQASEGESLDVQGRVMAGYAQMQDLRIERVLVERGVSGSRPLSERPEGAALLDVREPWEHRLASIPGARLVPLGALPAALSTFDPNEEYVLLCHHGVRSLTGLRMLQERGLTRVAHLAGGIDAWSTEVDPRVPRY